MSSEPDLTTKEGLRDYLKAHGQSREIIITPLSGGNANFVYRVSETLGSTTIFKHASSHLARHRTFALDTARMNYEARALEIFSPTPDDIVNWKNPSRPTVNAVRLLSYDEKHKLLCLEDGGSRNLKDAYDDIKLNMTKIGEELAIWLSKLHAFSREISLALLNQDDSAQGNNNPIAISIYRHSYVNLHLALSQYGHDPQLANEINEKYGSLISVDDECVCHGDFWPGNVLVRLLPSQENAPDLTIVDWEIVRRGTSATDVGQFAAEAFLLDRFRGNRGLLPAFMDTYGLLRRHDYIETIILNKEWITKMVVHWAVHIAFWPTRVVWTDKQGTQELVDLGVGVLQNVLDDNWEKLLDLPLFGNLREQWKFSLAWK